MKILGSQSGQQTQIPSATTQFIDIFSHSLNQALTFETEIPRLFTQEKLSLSQIAEKLGTSRDRVRNTLARLKISRPKAPADSALTAQVPFGWKKANGKLVAHVAEQRVLEKITKARAEGESLHSIARSLTIAGIKAKNGGKWHARTVSRILERNESFLKKSGQRPRSK